MLGQQLSFDAVLNPQTHTSCMDGVCFSIENREFRNGPTVDSVFTDKVFRATCPRAKQIANKFNLVYGRPNRIGPNEAILPTMAVETNLLKALL
jgi:hypothetical protein